MAWQLNSITNQKCCPYHVFSPWILTTCFIAAKKIDTYESCRRVNKSKKYQKEQLIGDANTCFDQILISYPDSTLI